MENKERYIILACDKFNEKIVLNEKLQLEPELVVLFNEKVFDEIKEQLILASTAFNNIQNNETTD